MNNRQSQSGMTLIEVIATLLLSSLIIVLIGTAISVSMKHNIMETKRLKLQQESNYIMAKLQNVHRYNECYELVILNAEMIVNNCENEVLFQETISSGYHYFPNNRYTIKPKNEDLIISDFYIKDAHKDKPLFELPLVITRYKAE